MPNPTKPPAIDPANPDQTPAQPLPDPLTPAPTPAPPPAAKVVAEGTKSEREVALEREKKGLQTRVAELEDENRTLKTPPPPRTKKGWLEDATMLDD